MSESAGKTGMEKVVKVHYVVRHSDPLRPSESEALCMCRSSMRLSASEEQAGGNRKSPEATERVPPSVRLGRPETIIPACM